MANYYGSFRSNYVKLKEGKHKLFEDILDRYNLTFMSKDFDGIEHVGLMDDDMDGGGIPWYYTVEDEKTGQFEDTDINWSEFGPLMEDGQVLHITEVGQEKMRYLTGFAMFIRSDGKIKTVNIADKPASVRNFIKKHNATVTECCY